MVKASVNESRYFIQSSSRFTKNKFEAIKPDRNPP
jgi:hypothetical protein